MSWQAGEKAGDYEILAVLGAGGMGKVYKVRNLFSGRIEAIKVLLDSLEGNEELADRFLREIRVLASLEHPNIARLHTASRQDNRLVMVMEFVEGRSVDAMLRDGPLAPEKAVRYTIDVLEALDYAHRQGIVHRDIKPANIMVTPRDTVKLMDFGIARAANERLTRTGHTVGSLYYMSPEQINGEPQLDARCDIYALGITLYEMVTGQRPFQGQSDYSILSAHLTRMPVPPIEVDPRVSPALNQIILVAIAKDRGQRFQSAAAMKKALEKALAEMGMAQAPTMAAPALQPQRPPAVAPVYPAPPTAPPPPSPPAQPQFSSAPQPPYAAASVPAAQGGGRRALYILAGSLATLVVLVVTAVQIPRWRGTHANPPQPFRTSSPAAQQPPSGSPAGTMPAGQITAGSAAIAEGAAQSGALSGSGPLATPRAASAGRGPLPAAPGRDAASPPSGTYAAAGETTPQAPATRAVPASPPAAGAAAGQPQAQREAAQHQQEAVRQAVARIREELMLMATRVSAVGGSLDNLRRAQARSGLGLRGDLSAAEQRLRYRLDQCEGALNAGDPDAARKHLDAAERDLGFLEKALGR